MDIDIDFDVFKALTIRRASESTTYNDVLRDLLGLPGGGDPAPAGDDGGWTWKGVTLPNGTELRADYKGKRYLANIEGGEWMQDQEARSSPSAAAHSITGNGVNGWWFWEVKRPSDVTWTQLGKLRPE